MDDRQAYQGFPKTMPTGGRNWLMTIHGHTCSDGEKGWSSKKERERERDSERKQVPPQEDSEDNDTARCC